MSYHDFMITTLVLQGIMCALAIPAGIIAALCSEHIPRRWRIPFFIGFGAVMAWPWLTQVSGIIMGAPPAWFNSIFGA